MASELIIIEQREVDFYDDTLTAVKTSDNAVMVSIRHLCDALGLDRASQVRRIKRNEILVEGYEGGVMVTSPGGNQRVGMIQVDLVPFWLARIDTSRVREEIRPKLIRFQKEVARVLWDAFQAGELTSDSAVNDLLQNASPETAEAYQIAKAVYQLARRQLVTEAQLSDHEQRLQLLEARYGDESRYIDNKQVSMIQQAVKAIALEMGRRSGGNEFGGIYGELYRRYEIGDYRALPAVRFEEAMKFLSDWHSTITGSELPF